MSLHANAGPPARRVARRGSRPPRRVGGLGRRAPGRAWAGRAGLASVREFLSHTAQSMGIGSVYISNPAARPFPKEPFPLMATAKRACLPTHAGLTMARTKRRVLEDRDRRTAEQRAAAAARKTAAIYAAARIASTQELESRPVKMLRTRASETESSTTDSDEEEVGTGAFARRTMQPACFHLNCVARACPLCAGPFALLWLTGVGGSCILRVCLRESPALSRRSS